MLHDESTTPSMPSTPTPVPLPQHPPLQAVQEPTPKKKRKTRSSSKKDFKVSVITKKLDSVATIKRSGPAAAAADLVRASISHIPLNEKLKVWVKSTHRYHPYHVERNYDNPKLRRFSMVKAGNPIPITDGDFPEHQIPKSLLNADRFSTSRE